MLNEQLNEYWKTVINTMNDGLMVVDREGTIVDVNRALEKISGYSRRELLGRSCSELQCDVCQIARDGGRGQWCVILESKQLFSKRCNLRHKSGSWVPVFKNASPLRDGSGQVIGAVETITDISALVERDREIHDLRNQLKSEDGFQGIVGRSPLMLEVFELIRNAAQSEAPVIISGESGTGKELVAQAIHNLGPRKRGPFISVNCAALNESILESELFGHAKGSFTGAFRDRKGRFEAAHGGNLFLDEIGDIPLSIQVKLLRVLESKKVERVGDHRPISVDVRIISATNRDLEQMTREGKFRQDLFYRINVIPINLPPLRERPEDIPLLVDTFVQRIRAKTGKPINGVSRQAMQLMLDYWWPGNIRELKNAIEFAFVLCLEGAIQPHHLPPALLGKEWSSIRGAGRKPSWTVLPRKEREKKELLEALRLAQGNQTRAARLLGVSRVTVWNRMRRYGIDLRKEIRA